MHVWGQSLSVIFIKMLSSSFFWIYFIEDLRLWLRAYCSVCVSKIWNRDSLEGGKHPVLEFWLVSGRDFIIFILAVVSHTFIADNWCSLFVERTSHPEFKVRSLSFPLEPSFHAEEYNASWHISFQFVKADAFKWENVISGEPLVFSQQANSCHHQYKNTTESYSWFCHHYNENR